MKKITLILLFFTIFANAQTNNYQVGDVVDDFTVTDTEGNEYNLYSLIAEGKYVWLDFFFVDCVPCQGSAPTFNEFFDKYGCNGGDVFAISINNGNDNNARVRQYEIDHGGPFNHAPAVSNEGGGPAVDNNFGVNAYPTFCLIGPGNKMLNRDIWPLNGIETFENTFPAGFDPEVIQCSLGVSNATAFDFNIYPSISNGNVNINLPSNMESSVAIFNTLGQQVFQNNYSERNINLILQLAQGVYIVKVSASDSSVNKRIIIK
ncbi:Peroxiredoxin [Aequorivita sublithincola DSM 14238]|uniref:Peroxiredoxin n=1 Tax=Aequorivita sublithincola (strain DSM 14238 / LMG 21431 / ACAM 643 / 9-3) TaxID=746697 RepID=I3Z063_AEQSU|nr:T9SS type A sorting domain-containing protein [Aequorivita sublithincola]AFL82631.1 Peroxiredoxin [Aequorivita sublithincola DSM 14238]